MITLTNTILLKNLFIFWQCVKGLVFADICRVKLNINAQNERGDTPLHLAAKWGYGKILFEKVSFENSLYNINSSILELSFIAFWICYIENSEILGIPCK